MADPLSITASVAGLVSLGIQVVGGITKYLEAVRERKNDVASVKAQVVRTQNLLTLVVKVAVKAEPNHSTTAAFLKNSASVQPELQALDELVQRLDTTKLPQSSHEVLGKVYVQAKKLTYPFHRPTMDRLQSQLVRVNLMLQAALQVSGLDVAINIERHTSDIKTTLPDLARQVSEQIKQENLVSRDAVARVGDSVMSLSRNFDRGLAKVLEDIAATSTASVSVLNEDHAEKHSRLLQEASMTRKCVSELNDTVKGVDIDIVKLQEDIATTSITSVSLLRQDYAENHSRVLEELVVNRRSVSELGDKFKRLDLALRALPTREDLGRLISKPGHLKGLCDIMEETPAFINSQHSSFHPRTSLARRICICQKRVTRSRRALMWGPWQVLTDASTTHDHIPDCICHSQDAAVSSKRWAVAFKGLQGLTNRAIEVSFSYSFGAGGGSLSPSFTYYPTIDRRRDPAFRIMSLFNYACLKMHWCDSGLEEFLEQCLENIALLYRLGKASPKAVDLYGRSVLHYFAKLSTYLMDHQSLLTGLRMLVKHGAQATLHDVYGSTPAWNIICRQAGPWFWNTSNEHWLEGPGAPSNWDLYSLLSDFMCTLEPYESIVSKSQLDFVADENTTMELSAIMQRSSATAEAFGCGPLSLAALEGNLQKMNFLLTNYRNTINELNLLKQTPLHLAVGHPSCVALLLRESGSKLINLPDSGSRRPMDYALFCCQFGTRAGESQYHDNCLRSHGDTSLKILLDADCMITKMESWPRDRYDSERSLCDICLHEVSEHLVSRRERLKRLAATRLPRMQANALGVFSPSVLDSNVIRVLQALDQRDIYVPPSLQVDGSDREGFDELTSAYHNFYGPFSFSALWSLGFRDFDIPNTGGLTPLMSWCKQNGWKMTDTDAGRYSWLIEKGADLWKLFPEGGLTIGHELYSSIGQMSPPPEGNEEHSRRFVFNLTRELSHRDPRDRCRCACSLGGCTPFVQYLQAVFAWRGINSASRVIEDLPRIMAETHTSVTKGQMRSAVRYATFQMLGIRHTCCMCYFHLHRQNEELDELRQEDRFLVACLEDLVGDFEVELDRMGQERYVNKCVSFWHGCWFARMQKVLESIESAEIEGPDKAAAEEVGVVWNESESSEDEDCDEDCDSESEDRGYHESDWDSDVDEHDMFSTLRTMDGWASRLDLIMSKAGLSAGQ